MAWRSGALARLSAACALKTSRRVRCSVGVCGSRAIDSGERHMHLSLGACVRASSVYPMFCAGRWESGWLEQCKSKSTFHMAAASLARLLC